MPKPMVLCILDGWGYRPEEKDNAVAQARTPHWDRLWNTCPHALLETSGLHVGLPEGQMGNSEVGHLTIGAGRVIYQDLPKITRAIETGELDRNPALGEFITKLKLSGGTAHLMGLTSPGGVHAHQDHIAALARILHTAGLEVAVHIITDGRDVPPQSAAEQVARFVASLPEGVQVVSLSGRYFAMDRDKRWERIELAYRAMVQGQAESFNNVVDAITAAYAKGETDEFIKPQVMAGYTGMKDGDGLLFANFRADRARQILTALLDPAFAEFARPALTLAAAAGMVEYSTPLNRFMTLLFPPKELAGTLGEVVSRAGLTQLRVAETEKYAHVTFFLNGGEEKVYAGEERALVPSPKVATYDLQPEMSAAEVARICAEAIESQKFDLIVVNYANPDMVGHTGILSAAIQAVEAVDAAVGTMLAALEKVGGAMLVTADHGNCEEMYDEQTHGPHTAHSLNKVPVVLFGMPPAVKLHDGSLADIAPTVLSVMQLPQPEAMTGKSLMSV